MNDYSLEKLRKDPVFWMLLYLALPTFIGVAVVVGEAVIHRELTDPEFGIKEILSTPFALYLGLGRQIPRAQAIKAAAVQERAMIDNDHIRIEDPDMDDFINKTLGEDE